MAHHLIGSLAATMLAFGASASGAQDSYPLSPADPGQCYEVSSARRATVIEAARQNYLALLRSCGDILDGGYQDTSERNRDYYACQQETAHPARDHWYNLQQQNSAELDICLQQAHAAQVRANEERRAQVSSQYDTTSSGYSGSSQVGMPSTMSVVQGAPKQIVYSWGASTTSRMGMNYATGGNWMASGLSPRMRAMMGATSILSQLAGLQQDWGNLSGAGRLNGSIGLGQDLMGLLANSNGGSAQGRLSAMISVIGIGLILRMNEAAQEDLRRSLQTAMAIQNFSTAVQQSAHSQEAVFRSYLGTEPVGDEAGYGPPADDLRAQLDAAQQGVAEQLRENGGASTEAMRRVAEDRARAREAERQLIAAANRQAEEQRQRANQQRRQAERQRARQAPPPEPAYTFGDFMMDAAIIAGQAYIQQKNVSTNSGTTQYTREQVPSGY